MGHKGSWLRSNITNTKTLLVKEEDRICKGHYASLKNKFCSFKSAHKRGRKNKATSLNLNKEEIEEKVAHETDTAHAYYEKKKLKQYVWTAYTISCLKYFMLATQNLKTVCNAALPLSWEPVEYDYSGKMQ